MLESNDEFQFRPITRGLGFHGAQNSLPQNSPAGRASADGSGAFGESGPETKSGVGPGVKTNPFAGQNKAVTAHSVSRLISSLPNLDFQESDLRQLPSKPGLRSAPLLHTPLGHHAVASTSTTSAPPAAPTSAAGRSSNFQVGVSAGPVSTAGRPAAIPGIPARDARRMGPVVGTETDVSRAKRSSRIPVTLSAVSAVRELVSRWTRPTAAVPGLAETRDSRKPAAVVVDEVKYRETPVQVSAAIFDLLVVAGVTCLFAVALLLVTNTDLGIVLHNARSDWATRAGILLLLFSVHALYMVGSRAVAGCTLGEWAFDIEVGLPHQQVTAWYPLAICARYIVTVLTGYIALPLISMIMGRDVTANLCGIKLYQVVK